MILVTRESNAASWAKTFGNMYGTYCLTTFKLHDGRTAAQLKQQLEALGADPHPDDVDRIAGKSWTWIRCNECEEQVDKVVQLGNEPDYESSTAWICENCIAKALLLISGKLEQVIAR